MLRSSLEEGPLEPESPVISLLEWGAWSQTWAKAQIVGVSLQKSNWDMPMLPLGICILSASSHRECVIGRTFSFQNQQYPKHASTRVTTPVTGFGRQKLDTIRGVACVIEFTFSRIKFNLASLIKKADCPHAVGPLTALRDVNHGFSQPIAEMIRQAEPETFLSSGPFGITRFAQLAASRVSN